MNLKTKKQKNKKVAFIALIFALSQLSSVQLAFAVSISSTEMIALTNNSRLEAGLPALSVSDKLSVAAEKKAQDMFINQYFDHDSPQGLTPWDFIKSSGYEYLFAGENLAMNFITAGGAHKALMESSSHRVNILSVNYSEVGIAVVEDIFEGNKSIIIVEEFGAPFVNEEIMQIKSLQTTKGMIEEKVNEINEKAIEKDLESSQIYNQRAIDDSFSDEVKKGEILNSIDNNEKIKSNLTDTVNQSSSQKKEYEILIQTNLFQESNLLFLEQNNDANFLAFTNGNIFNEMTFERNIKESTMCNMLSDENFRNQSFIDSDNVKAELSEDHSSQIVQLFQNYANKSAIMLLTLFYAVVNILLIYKLVFVVIM